MRDCRRLQKVHQHQFRTRPLADNHGRRWLEKKMKLSNQMKLIYFNPTRSLKLTFTNYKFEKGRYAFYPIMLSRFAEKNEVRQKYQNFIRGDPYELGHCLSDQWKTLPKAQRTRGFSTSCQSNFLKTHQRFKHKSWSHFIFRISTEHQQKISTKHQHLHKT